MQLGLGDLLDGGSPTAVRWWPFLVISLCAAGSQLQTGEVGNYHCSEGPVRWLTCIISFDLPNNIMKLILSTLLYRELRIREVKWLLLGHTARKQTQFFWLYSSVGFPTIWGFPRAGGEPPQNHTNSEFCYPSHLSIRWHTCWAPGPGAVRKMKRQMWPLPLQQW